MAFNAGAIKTKATIDKQEWDGGLQGMVKGVGALSIAVGAVAVGAMVKATKASNEWQKSLANVSTLIDTNTTSMQDMTKQLLLLDPRLGKTTELTEAMYQSFSAGADDMEEALTITTDSAIFAQAALTDTATAVDVLTTAQNAYGEEVVNTTEASDIFFTTIKQGKINGEQLASTIGKSIPLFASLNVPLEELGAGMAAMTKQGVNAAESTTQLNAIMNSFLKPSEAMTEALAAQGYASGSALIEAEGLSGALTFLEESTGGSSDELSRLLPSVEAVRGALALTGTGGEEFSNILDEMSNAAGSTQEAFDKQELTFATLGSAMEKVELVAGNIGKHFADEIAVSATEAAGSMLTFVMSAQGAEVVGNLVGGISAGFELLKMTLEPVTSTIGPTLKELFSDIGGALGNVIGKTDEASPGFSILASSAQFTALSFEVTSKTIGLVTTGIIDLIAVINRAGGTLGTFYDMVRGEATWQDVKDSASEIGDSLLNFVNNVSENGDDLWSTMKDGVLSFGEVVGNQAIEMEASVTTSFNNQKDNIVSNWYEIITGQGDVNEILTEMMTEFNDGQMSDSDEVTNNQLTNIQKLTLAWKTHFNQTKLTAKAAFTSMLDAGSFMLDSLATIADLRSQNMTDSIELSYMKQEEALKLKLDNEQLSQEEYDIALAQLEEAKAKRLNSAEKKAFESNKRFQQAQIWMSAAASIASWWSTAGQLGPIAGPIFAGVMTGATLGMAGIQSAAVADQQFVPSRQFGGEASGLTRINEAGGEMVVLPDGSTVVPNDISRQIAYDSQGMTKQGNIYNFDFTNANFGNNDPDMMIDMISERLAEEMRAV